MAHTIRKSVLGSSNLFVAALIITCIRCTEASLEPGREWDMLDVSRQLSRRVSNLQSFSGSLGAAAQPITNSGNPERPFEVAGDTFTTFEDAGQRTCDNQFNACADAANEQAVNFQVSDCENQQSQCEAAQSSAPVKTFAASSSSNNGNTGQINLGPDPSNPDFDIVCDS